MTRLIITNGDNALQQFRAGGVEDAILPWRDVLHEGRVPDVTDRFEFHRVRTAELARLFFNTDDEIAEGFAERERVLASLPDHARVEIWLEHDLYDQLQLLDILDALEAAGRETGVYIVQADDYLGTQAPDEMLRFEDSIQPVSLQMRHEAAQAWGFFTQGDCKALENFAHGLTPDLTSLPWMGKALIRFLAEFPDTASGLSRTQRWSLEELAQGPQPAGKLFGAISAREDAMFMGDLSYLRVLDTLAAAPVPAITGVQSTLQEACRDEAAYRAYAQSDLALTDFGRALLAGDADFIAENGIDQWFGGYHATGRETWRWNEAGQTLRGPGSV
ncbi:DUF1835 domain-containing protein [Tepidamorphus sp. 3E244]|uniref:DUF1835 domain-containing protein n=1 Tax=Tepidamorphus sp. 3E244 TaxID=3385498 RepID=UPI0038FC0224